MAFVHGFMGEHRLADNIADGINMRHIGAHLLVHLDKAALGHGHAGFFGTNQFAVGRAAGGHQHRIVAQRLFGRVFTLEGDINTVFFRLHGHGFGVDHNVVEAVFIELLPHFHQIAVGALHQAVHHFHHIQACAQSAVNRAHFQADDAAADDQHFLRHFFQFQRTARVDNARVLRNKRQIHHAAAGGDDAVFKAYGFFLAGFGGFFILRAVGERHFDMVRAHKLPFALNHIHLAGFGHAGQAAGELADHFFFISAQHIDIQLGLGVFDAVGRQMAYFVNHIGIVQQGFGGNTAHIQAHAAQGVIALDNGHFQAFIGCGKSSGIAAGAAAQHHHIVVGIGAAAKCCRLRRCCGRFGRFCCRRCRFFFGFGRFSRADRFNHGNHAAFGNFVAHFHLDFFHHTGRFSRHIHRGFVGFQSNQGIFNSKRVARFDFNGDDVHIFVAADIGHFQFD